nr:hypothetical protein [Tanacetum cinerariifolium]
DSNLNLELYATPVEKQTRWFIASIQFIKGLVNEDFNVSQDDGVGVVSGNCDDLKNNYSTFSRPDIDNAEVAGHSTCSGADILDGEVVGALMEFTRHMGIMIAQTQLALVLIWIMAKLPLLVDEFADDFMDVLNDEESIPNCSLDDMKLQDEEEKLISTPAPVNHQQVDELIDVHEDKTTVLQENVKTFKYQDLSNKSQYVNLVKEDYKACLGMVFANVKETRKKCGIERNYVLRSVKVRKKRLAMSLDSLFGQQATTTPAPPKTISMSVNGDFIVPPSF